jgi:hypothetical protein
LPFLAFNRSTNLTRSKLLSELATLHLPFCHLPLILGWENGTDGNLIHARNRTRHSTEVRDIAGCGVEGFSSKCTDKPGIAATDIG